MRRYARVVRERIERGQVWIYLACIGLGFMLGSAVDAAGERAEPLIWPVLAMLLYVTFVQVPLTSLRASVQDTRFIAAVLAGNFVVVPVVVWLVIIVVPLEPAIMLGVVLVLLVPCTDWYITFTHLAGGDAARAIAVTPLNLLFQFLLLPVYLALFIGDTFAEIVVAAPVATVFVTLIVAPLAAAHLTERVAQRRGTLAALRRRTGVLPVPLLGVVLFLVATAQVHQIEDALEVLPRLTVAFVLFLLAAVGSGWLIARLFRLPAAAARAAVLSLSSRNSFVVLPIALALPQEWRAAVVVVVYQSLVELLGLSMLLWVLPRLIRTPVGRS